MDIKKFHKMMKDEYGFNVAHGPGDFISYIHCIKFEYSELRSIVFMVNDVKVSIDEFIYLLKLVKKSLKAMI